MFNVRARLAFHEILKKQKQEIYVKFYWKSFIYLVSFWLAFIFDYEMIASSSKWKA